MKICVKDLKIFKFAKIFTYFLNFTFLIIKDYNNGDGKKDKYFMKTIRIGKANATFQQLVAIKENRNKRIQTQLFFVEGVQNIKEAIANGWEIYAFIISSATRLSDWAKSVQNFAEFNYIIDENLMLNLSDKDNPSEMLAIVKMKQFSTDFKGLSNPIFVLLDRPSKKGNLGTIIRSCDALGVSHIFYSGRSVDVYDRAVITASMGSFFKTSKSFISSNTEFLEILDDLKRDYPNLKVVGTSLQTSTLVQELDFTTPVLLLMGNEAEGLSRFYNEQADNLVKIEMFNNTDSLNIACATTVCLYEINRQRGASFKN